MYCKNCNNEIEEESIFCSYCGIKIKNVQRELEIKKELEGQDMANIILSVIVGIIVFIITVNWLTQSINSTDEYSYTGSSTKANNAVQTQEKEDTIIQSAPAGGRMVYLKKDSSNNYYLECNGKKIYETYDTSGTTSFNKKDYFVWIDDSKYDGVIAWAGGYYAVKNDELQKAD